ncbi:MAG: M48 family metalloprotease [Cytophagales bacterium]|nr:M48 family metalloprotease [Bernardetiaceae bacterium]MDW8211191.1 M48 family metalloprotease [Cytophagales bacterium]
MKKVKKCLFTLCGGLVLINLPIRFAQAQINLFSIQDEIKLGQQVARQVESDPKNRILDEKQYPEAYRHLRRITNTILNSGQVRYRNEFPWQVKIIHNDSILNAFCAPGGFIYVYTGIIKFLDTEDQFAGVLAHEIAHADRRHATTNLTRMYGIAALTEIILGKNPNRLVQIAQGLLGLQFSRNHERDADNQSVLYLCHTHYAPNGAAGFFEKMLQRRSAEPPAFLSTHPASSDRIRDINAAASTMNCPSKQGDKNYQAFKASLPR